MLVTTTGIDVGVYVGIANDDIFKYDVNNIDGDDDEHGAKVVSVYCCTSETYIVPPTGVLKQLVLMFSLYKHTSGTTEQYDDSLQVFSTHAVAVRLELIDIVII